VAVLRVLRRGAERAPQEDLTQGQAREVHAVRRVGEEALDLAAALIKLSRLGPVEPPVDLTAALVHSPASVMNARVERLITWNDERRVPPAKYSPWYGLSAALVAVAAFAVTYSQLLVHVHTATEWLVR